MGHSNIKMEKFMIHNYLTSQNDFKKVYRQLKMIQILKNIANKSELIDLY